LRCFCENGFFTPEETSDIIAEGLKHGLKPKIHANQLSFSQGIQIGVKYNAISVDHLEYTDEDEIKVLLQSNTVPTVLPSASFYLNMQYPPAKKMIESGLLPALASDYNPGSSPSGNMNFVISLACIKMKMTPEQALLAATIYGARAMELEQTHGSIEVGKKANIIITKPMQNFNFLPYSFGDNLIDTVFVNGIKY
jgi:imidazolonepropionase